MLRSYAADGNPNLEIPVSSDTRGSTLCKLLDIASEAALSGVSYCTIFRSRVCWCGFLQTSSVAASGTMTARDRSGLEAPLPCRPRLGPQIYARCGYRETLESEPSSQVNGFSSLLRHPSPVLAGSIGQPIPNLGMRAGRRDARTVSGFANRRSRRLE
jgi:hypothetical protein